MRFWTIQPGEIWKQMRRGAPIRVDPAHPKYGGRRPPRYDWLASALRRHCTGFDGGWPWWLRCERPDLDRARAEAHPGGAEQALLELELPADRCAVFPLWMWETIYTGHYVALTRGELDAWYRKLRSTIPEYDLRSLPKPWCTQLESSWDRMFDRNIDPRCWYRDDELPLESDELYLLLRDASDEMVGLAQELRATDAVNVTPFTAAR